MVITVIMANTLILSLLYGMDRQYGFIGFDFDSTFMLFVVSKVIIYAFAFTGISTLCLYIGMIKKSQAATIISSIILVSVVGSSSNGYSLSTYVIIPVIIASIGGVFMTYLTFRKIEHIDV